MLVRLPESSRSMRWPVGGTVVSIAAHVLVVALTLANTRPGAPQAVDQLPQMVAGVALRWVKLAPPPPPNVTKHKGAPVRTARGGNGPDVTPPSPTIPDEVLTAVATTFAIPDVEPPGADFEALVTRPDDFQTGKVGSAMYDPLARLSAHPQGEPFSQTEVDRMVSPLPSNPRPAYPPQLIRAQVTGEVIAEFVVDSTGTLDMRSVRILHASHALFESAVRKVLPRYHYAPAEVGGFKVAVRVEQPFSFVLR